jgi:hypothetical protein
MNHLKPAVATTGFNLVRLDENAPGLIDDRMRDTIRVTLPDEAKQEN